MECIRRLADSIDSSYNEQLEIEELYAYIKKHKIPFTDDEVRAMFKEAGSGRGFVSEEQMNGPITHKEIAAAVRGRHKWNQKTKDWEIKYRYFRNYWITLLLTVNKKIFALSMPKIIPQRIKAQFELEEEYQQTVKNMGTSKMSFRPHTTNLYNSITNIYVPSFQADKTKNEAGIKPEMDMESTIRITKPVVKSEAPISAFET